MVRGLHCLLDNAHGRNGVMAGTVETITPAEDKLRHLRFGRWLVRTIRVTDDPDAPEILRRYERRGVFFRVNRMRLLIDAQGVNLTRDDVALILAHEPALVRLVRAERIRAAQERRRHPQ